MLSITKAVANFGSNNHLPFFSIYVISWSKSNDIQMVETVLGAGGFKYLGPNLLNLDIGCKMGVVDACDLFLVTLPSNFC